MIPSATVARRVAVAAASPAAPSCWPRAGRRRSPSAGATATETVTTTARRPGLGHAAEPGSSSSAPAGPAACATSALSAKPGQGNGAAGSTIVPLEFTNTSARPARCSGTRASRS